MLYMSYLAPGAFVLALAALSQVMSLKKEVESLKRQIERDRENWEGSGVQF